MVNIKNTHQKMSKVLANMQLNVVMKLCAQLKPIFFDTLQAVQQHSSFVTGLCHVSCNDELGPTY